MHPTATVFWFEKGKYYKIAENEIKAEFEVIVGRPATDEDIRRGLSFAIGGYLRPVNENSEEEE